MPISGLPPPPELNDPKFKDWLTKFWRLGGGLSINLGGSPEKVEGNGSAVAIDAAVASFKQGTASKPKTDTTLETPVVYVERYTNNPSTAVYADFSGSQLQPAVLSEIVAGASEWGSPAAFAGRVTTSSPKPSDSSLTISSLTRSSSTATAVTSTAHGYTTGWQVTVSGAAQTEYNITATITVVNTTTFTYTVSGTPATPATGSPVVSKTGAGPLIGVVGHCESFATSGTHRSTWGANFIADFNNTGASKPVDCVGIEVDVIPGISASTTKPGSAGADNFTAYWAQVNGGSGSTKANTAFYSSGVNGGKWQYGAVLNGIATTLITTGDSGSCINGIDFSGNTFSGYAWLSPSAAISGAGGITSASPSAGIGYTTGAGGTNTQSGSKSTGVTVNKICGTVTMHNAALAAGAKVTFTVSSNVVLLNDGVFVWVASGGTASAYRAAVTAVGSGSFNVTVENITGGSLSESPVIGFAVIRAVAS